MNILLCPGPAQARPGPFTLGPGPAQARCVEIFSAQARAGPAICRPRPGPARPAKLCRSLWAGPGFGSKARPVQGTSVWRALVYSTVALRLSIKRRTRIYKLNGDAVYSREISW